MIACVIGIVVILIYLLLKKELRTSVYGKCTMSAISAFPNIFTARTIGDSKGFFVIIHALGLLMISIWLAVMAFEVWYSIR